PRCSALLRGAARTYRVERYRTTLSIKAVTRGAAFYSTRRGRHLVTEDTFLVLNHGQEYDLEFRDRGTTETLCPFFQGGFLQHAAASSATLTDRQLDEIGVEAPPAEFCERLYPMAGPVARALVDLRRGVASPGACDTWIEDRFYNLAAALVELRGQI